MTANQYCLAWLQGQGDTHVKILTQEDMAWVENEDLEAPPPASTMERIRAVHEEEADDWQQWVTPGSWDNDRVLLIPGITVDGVELDSYTDARGALAEVESWKKLLNVTEFDHYEGCIY